MTIFPVIVLGVFTWLVACHHEKLYAPKDFTNDESFLRGINEKRDGRPALKELDGQIKSKIKEVLESDDFQSNLDMDSKERIADAVERISDGIRSSSFITVDATELTNDQEDVF